MTDDRQGVDGSNARALPLVHVHARCDDCTPPQRPAVWVASCCSCLLCPGCLASGLHRRHGPCRSPGVLGLLPNATATFESTQDPATFYVWRQVTIDLRIRTGNDLISGDGGRYIIRSFVSLTDLHSRRHVDARRIIILYHEVELTDGQHVLHKLNTH
jgi:hypothetical protein